MDTETVTPTPVSIRCRIESVGRPIAGTVAVKVQPDSGPRLVLHVSSVRSMVVTHSVAGRRRVEQRKRATSVGAADSERLLRKLIGATVRIATTPDDQTAVSVMSLRTI